MPRKPTVQPAAPSAFDLNFPVGRAAEPERENLEIGSQGLQRMLASGKVRSVTVTGGPGVPARRFATLAEAIDFVKPFPASQYKLEVDLDLHETVTT